MKVIELLAERAKIVALVEKSEYYTITVNNDTFGNRCQKNITEKQLEESYKNDLELLRRLDALNNTLFESDAKNYVEVMGNSLSVATARRYLDEFYVDILLDRSRDGLGDIREHEEIFEGTNLRALMLSNCIVRDFDEVDKDPLNLKDRAGEFEKKKLAWYYGLKTAVAIADATTEVPFPY